MLLVHRTALRRRLISGFSPCVNRTFQTRSSLRDQGEKDPRIDDLGNVLKDEFAAIREDYQAPKNPIILAHGLLGFDELHLVSQRFPGIHYWYGVREALAAKGIEVITASVPPCGSIEARAAELANIISTKAKGKGVNIIA